LQSNALLVYDNVSSPEEIADLLPSGGARLLITSRFSDFSAWAEEITLDVLPREEAVALLQSRADRKDAAGAKTLAEALGCLPLALDHAAAYCKRTQVRFADYAVKAATLIASVPRGSGYPRSVAATFDLALSQAVSQCASTEVLMGFLAQCAPERIPMLLVEGAIDDEGERLQALAALAEVSLLKHDPFDDGTEAVTVHRLVQAIARARLAATDLPHRVADRVISRLASIYPGEGYDNPETWRLCAQLTPHFLARQAHDATPTAANWPELLNRAGRYFHGRAVHAQAASFLREALAIRERVLGPEHPDTAQSLNNLAMVLRDQGDLAAARPLYERALTIRERVLGPQDRATAQSLYNLAGLLQAQGNFAGARPLFERALAIRERVFGTEHHETAQSLSSLALLLAAQGDPGRARPLSERALAIEEKVLGPEHPFTAAALNNIALLLQDLAAARPLYERALAINVRAFGLEHPTTATSLNNLAGLLRDQGDLAAARPLYDRALAVCEKMLGPEHPTTAVSLNNLAWLLEAQGDLTEARSLYERALAIYVKVLGPEHPGTASILSNLASLLSAQRDFAGARPLFERALTIAEKVLGPEHPGTNRVRCKLARFFLDTNDPNEALGLAESARTGHEKSLGRLHGFSKESACVNADALDALGRTEDAKVLRETFGLSGHQHSWAL
jgi:tetratricopeptide (TPR) repeat protein